MSLFKNYFKNRKTSFFVALATAVICLITAIIYAASFYGREHLEAYVSWIPTTFLIVGALAFFGASLFKLSQFGTVAMAICSLVSFVSYLSTIYGYPVEQIMVVNIDQIPEFATIVTCAVLMLASFITANVCAWKKQEKCEVANYGETKEGV